MDKKSTSDHFLTKDLNYSRHYYHWHSDTLEHRKCMKDWHGEVLNDLITHLPRGPALDMGCGMGFTMEYLIEKGFSPVRGYDINKEQIEVCKKHDLQCIQLDNIGEVLRAFSGPYTLITAFDFLEHLSVDEALITLRRVYEVLSPGGVFVCAVPNANSALAERWRYIDLTHLNSYTEHSLDLLLYGAGFKDIQIKEQDSGFHKRPGLRNRIGSWLSWINFKLSRSFRRWQFVSELGPEGKQIPLSLNLLGVAKK